MTVEFYGESKEVYEICKKGGRHQYYTIFVHEPIGVVNKNSQELKTVDPKHEELVKNIRIDFDAKDVYSIKEFPVNLYPNKEINMPKSNVTPLKSPACISAFQNESEVVTIEELTIENRLDRVSIHGSIDITRDKEGLENILALKRQIDTITEYLKRADLPEKIEVLEAKTVSNPFE